MRNMLLHESDLVSKYLNKKISVQISRKLMSYNATPNQMTMVGFVIGILAATMFFYELYIVGSVLTYLSALFDSIDGDLARLSGKTTEIGAFMDSVLDRIVDIAIIFALMANMPFNLWIVGILAVTGTFMVSYTRAKSESIGLQCKIGFASRDVRMLIITVGGLLNQIFPTLLLLAIVTNMTVFQRAFHVKKNINSTSSPSTNTVKS